MHELTESRAALARGPITASSHLLGPADEGPVSSLGLGTETGTPEGRKRGCKDWGVGEQPGGEGSHWEAL